MLFARLPDGSLVLAEPDLTAVCPGCDAAVVAKCGDVVIWHWAHARGTLTDCDPWTEPETEWHLGWKQQALERGSRVEVTMRDGDGWHRADILRPDGVIVEIQHSSLGTGELGEREQFYRGHGGLVWVFDARDKWWPFVRPVRGTGFIWENYSHTAASVRSRMFWDTDDGLFEVSVAEEHWDRLVLRVIPATIDDILPEPVVAIDCADPDGHHLIWFGTWAGETRCRACSPLLVPGEGLERRAVAS